jgi:hypothetical protein
MVDRGFDRIYYDNNDVVRKREYFDSTGKRDMLYNNLDSIWQVLIWHPNNQISSFRSKTETEFIMIEYYENGNVRTSTYTNNKTGYKTGFYNSGELQFFYHPSDTIQEFKTYHPNQNIKEKGKWISNIERRFDSYQAFDAQGNILIQGQYEKYDDKKKYKRIHREIRIGTWVLYNNNGKWLTKEYYDETGVLIKSKSNRNTQSEEP